MLSDVTEEVDITLGSRQTEVALGLATRAILTSGFWSKVILKSLSGDLGSKIFETESASADFFSPLTVLVLLLFRYIFFQALLFKHGRQLFSCFRQFFLNRGIGQDDFFLVPREFEQDEKKVTCALESDRLRNDLPASEEKQKMVRSAASVSGKRHRSREQRFRLRELLLWRKIFLVPRRRRRR